MDERDRRTYRKRFAEVIPKGHSADQRHSTAGIARTKYRQVRNDHLAFFVTLPFWAFAVYLIKLGGYDFPKTIDNEVHAAPFRI